MNEASMQGSGEKRQVSWLGGGAKARRRTRVTTERKIVGGFGAALLVLCVVAGVSVWLTTSLLSDLEAVSQQNEILSQISAANGLLSQLATSARLYAVDRTDASYADWERQEEEFESKLQAIGESPQISDSESQRVRVASLTQMLRDKVVVTTRDANRQTLDAAWGIREGISQMRPLSDTLLKMGDEERGDLRHRNEAATRAAIAALWTIGLASLLAVVLVGGSAVVILRELGARRRASEELERARHAAEMASMAKSAFVANMSHELRTPLTSILGYADLLLGPEGGGAKREEYLHTMRRSGEHLLTLINDILDLSKIEAGGMTIEAVECRLVDVLADVESLMRPRAVEKGISFSVEYSTPIPERVMTDPTRLRQIVMNLVGNAVKFTDEGLVRVVVEYRSGLSVAVIDTGIGISREQQGQLFQEFGQADVSTTRRFGGTGLGLSISRRLARMMSGDISVESELRKGSTFRLWIPMTLGEGSPMLPPGEARRLVGGWEHGQSQRLRKLRARVLLAEDGMDNREVITLHLRQAGCQVTVAGDGQAARDHALGALARGEPFDVILMDMQMPIMDGYTAAAKLRSEGYRGVIIALTAHALPEDRERCLRAGCDEYAAKPIQMPRLLELIERLSGRIAQETVTDRLLEDPVLRDLTRRFCQGTVDAIEGMREMGRRGALAELAVVAHRLTGAGGAYGFHDITREAKELERLARAAASTEEVEGQIARLEAVCGAARDQLQLAESHVS